MKKLLLLLIVIPTIAHAQSISLDSLHHEFERYLTGPRQPDIHANGETYTSFELKFEPDSRSLLASFAADNGRVIEYLGVHYHDLKDEYLCWRHPGPDRFLSAVADSQYRNLYFENLTQLMARYLKAKQHITVEGLDLNSKPSLTFGEMQTAVAKFFYADGSIFPGGSFGYHVCIGINGYMRAPHPRNMMLEAVAFSVVYEPSGVRNDLMDEMDNAINVAKNLELSGDDTTKFLREQGAVMGIMSQDPILAKDIRDIYAEKKDWLTFELK
jgi:hypothetical protein